MIAEYVCECGGSEGPGCGCPPGHVRSWVRDRLVVVAYHREEARSSVGAFAGHVLLPAELALADALGLEAVRGGPAVDHRALLVKYIRHVRMETGLDNEGLNAFLAESERQMARGAGILDAEWAELQRIAEEARRG